MQNKINRAWGLGILAIVVVGALLWSITKTGVNYNPPINPTEFSTKITNKYFSLPIGKKMIYEAETPEGREKVEIQILDETKNIMGVTTLVYWDRVWFNNELVEDTRDFLAQDKAGNVWYFGEEVNNYKDGKLLDHAGSWIAGEKGAKAGIWIKAEHKVGDSYRQEYYKGEAEDMRDVVAINQTVDNKVATYNNCVKMYDWTPLDPESKEYKYYCPSVGAMVLEEHLVRGEKMELTQIISP